MQLTVYVDNQRTRYRPHYLLFTVLLCRFWYSVLPLLFRFSADSDTLEKIGLGAAQIRRCSENFVVIPDTKVELVKWRYRWSATSILAAPRRFVLHFFARND